MIRPSVYTIPPHRSFADALVAGLMAREGRDRMTLARGLVLVPNNRAARAVQDAFVRRAEGGLLLPRLVPIGDPELDERIGAFLDPIDAEPIPPAVDPLQRQLILARLIEESGGAAGAEAMRLAAELARTLDQLHVEGVPPQRLREIDVGELTEHWARSLELFALVLEQWPKELARLGRIDLSDRRNRLLERVAKRWRETPPPGFVVAAGISTAAPAVAAVLRTVAFMSNGRVVFDALDTGMPEEQWAALGPHRPDPDAEVAERPVETHPQYHLKLLLDRMGVARGEVERWRWGGGHAARAGRSRLISNALAPARFTTEWTDLPRKERDRSGVELLEVATPAEEAQAIALALREALETPGRTAALVTPDRGLAQRVSAHLKRWDIEADDSAGVPLSVTPPGTLLLAIVEAAAERFAPVPLLALLKHPLVQAGEGRAEWLEQVRRLDRKLRGPRPAPGLTHLPEAVAAERAREWLGPLEEVFSRSSRAQSKDAGTESEQRPSITLGTSEIGSFAELLAAVREAAERLAGDEVWAKPAGRAAAEFFAGLEGHGAEGPARIAPDSLGPMLTELMNGVAVRPPQGGHPRIFIRGLIEARLQQADLTILAGLNEGTWPALPSPDPWLAPRIRAELGLPGLETRIGLAAHSFAGALGAPQVLITRARRDARGPAVASRFWLRLEALTGGLPRAGRLKHWAQALDGVEETKPSLRPAPAPPVAERPKRLSVTDLDRLKADPFAFYAKAMLKLFPLDMVDADPTAAWRGTAVHLVLQQWAEEDDCDPAKLRPRAEAFLAGADAHPLMRALWEPRLIEAIEWIAAEMAERKAEGHKVLAVECEGELDVFGVTLKGIADRIDRRPDGSLVIVDYKTGNAPSPKQVASGYAQQLGLIGLMAERGAFDGVAGTAGAFEYWSLARNTQDGFGKIVSPVDPAGKGGRIFTDQFVARAASNLQGAVERWLTGAEPFTAKLHPEHAPYGDYDQLMRLDEWYGRDASPSPLAGEGDSAKPSWVRGAERSTASVAARSPSPSHSPAASGPLPLPERDRG
ncbi:double-strand break repair protein AddB [Sphingomonas sp.]|uniref:double-strand break repair protein AddB n=1 Tax=Sphingomonas sp. TaxID=28214 RepID=UPI002DB5A717|nr:double-strand break repair protein AddB [Sphingomonas sp.]HEU4967589.1 double-strand break repair protein AddB [Sphingomonas sp.]